MTSPEKIVTPSLMATQAFTDAPSAVERLEQIYARNTAFLRDRFEAYGRGEALGACALALVGVAIAVARRRRRP